MANSKIKDEGKTTQFAHSWQWESQTAAGSQNTVVSSSAHLLQQPSPASAYQHLWHPTSCVQPRAFQAAAAGTTWHQKPRGRTLTCSHSLSPAEDFSSPYRRHRTTELQGLGGISGGNRVQPAAKAGSQMGLLCTLEGWGQGIWCHTKNIIAAWAARPG